MSDFNALPPMQSLIVDVLGARRRTGEALWTFSNDAAVVRAARALEAAGVVTVMSGVVEKTIRVRFTDAAWRDYRTLSDEPYLSPVEQQLARAQQTIHAYRTVFADLGISAGRE